MPEDINALLKEAESDYESRQFDNAQEKLKKIIEADLQNDKAVMMLADIYAIRGLINSVINQYFSLINILEARGDLRKSLDVCGWILRLDSENINVRMKIILIYQKLGDKNEVIRQSLSLARLLIELGQGDQSILLLQKTQETSPDNLEVGSELAEIYISYGHIPEAVAQYKKIAASYFEKGLINKAADTYKRLKLVVPEEKEIMISLGKIYIELNQYKEAESEFRSVLRIDLNNMEALMLLGEVCQKKGQYKDAVLAFTKVIAIDAQEVRALEKLGELFQEQGKIKDAVKNYINAAQNYQLMGNIEKAVKIYQKILIIDSTNPVACRELTNLGASLTSAETESVSKAKTAEPEKDFAEKEEVEKIYEEAPVAAAEYKEIEEEPFKKKTEEEAVETEMPPEKESEIFDVLSKKEEFIIKLNEEKEEEEPVIIINAKNEEDLKKIKKEEVKVKLDKHLIKTGLIKEGAAEGEPVGLIKDRSSATSMLKPGLIRSMDKEDSVRRKTGLIKGKLIPVETIVDEEPAEPKIRKAGEPETGRTKEAEKLAAQISIQDEFLAGFEIKEKEERSGVEEAAMPVVEAKEEVLTEKETLKEKVGAPEQAFEKPVKEVLIDEKIFDIDKLVISGKVSQGIEKCAELLSANPDDNSVRFELGKIYLEKGLLDQAIEIFDYLKQKDKENAEYRYFAIDALKWKGDFKELLSQYYQLSKILLKNNADSELIKLYQDIILLDEENIETKKKLAELYLKLGQKAEGVFYLENIAEDYIMRDNIAKAIEVYDKVFHETQEISVREKLAYLYKANNSVKESINEYRELAAAYSSLNDSENEIKAIENIIELDPENLASRIRFSELLVDVASAKNVENLFKIGVIYSSSGEKEKARQYLEKLIMIDEGYAPAYDRLVDVYFELKDKENALKYADILINSYEEEKRYNEAADIYKRIINYDPDDVKARTELSRIYMLSEEKEKAANELLQLVKTLSSKEDWEEVMSVYGKIIELNPENYEHHFNMGLVYFERLNKFKEAAAEFQKAFKISPRDIKAGQYLLNVYLKMNEPYKIVEIYRKLVAIDSSFNAMEQEIIDKYIQKIETKPDNLYYHYDLGLIYKEFGRIDEAIEQFQQSKKQNELLLKSYNMLGLSFAQKEEMGMFDLAIRQFKKALEIKGYPVEEYVEIKYNLGNLYFEKHYYREAESYFEEVTKEIPGYKDTQDKLKELGTRD